RERFGLCIRKTSPSIGCRRSRFRSPKKQRRRSTPRNGSSPSARLRSVFLNPPREKLDCLKQSSLTSRQFKPVVARRTCLFTHHFNFGSSMHYLRIFIYRVRLCLLLLAILLCCD